MTHQTYTHIEAYMRTCMSDSAHDVEHIYRVLCNALQIAEGEENVDRDVLIAACLLHDIGRQEQFAEHSMHRCIAAGRPDAQDEALCRRFAADVMAKADDAAPIQVPGNTPYKELKPSAVHPAANETCIKCGTCAKECPTGAIPLDDPSQTDNERCINCMRCVEACPMNSRALPEMFRAMIMKMLNEHAAGYKKPVVFL